MEKTPALACLVILLKRIVATFESFKCNNGPARLFRVKALEVMVSTRARTCVWDVIVRGRVCVCVRGSVYVCVTQERMVCVECFKCVCECMCIS